MSKEVIREAFVYTGRWLAGSLFLASVSIMLLELF